MRRGGRWFAAGWNPLTSGVLGVGLVGGAAAAAVEAAVWLRTSVWPDWRLGQALNALGAKPKGSVLHHLPLWAAIPSVCWILVVLLVLTHSAVSRLGRHSPVQDEPRRAPGGVTLGALLVAAARARALAGLAGQPDDGEGMRGDRG